MIAYTILDVGKSGKPESYKFQIGDKLITRNLYKPGTGLTLAQVWDNLASLKSLMLTCNTNNTPIILSDYKLYLNHIKHDPIDSVYDYIGTNYANDDPFSDLLNKEPCAWANILAKAAPVYQFLEDRGLSYGYMHAEVKWSYDTYSGRSKSSGFNVQGATNGQVVSIPSSVPSDVFIHFDWVAADLRIASILSGDEALIKSFAAGDPYNDIAVNVGRTRDEAKLEMLMAINSMNYAEDILRYFPTMRSWISTMKEKLFDNCYLESILGRRFYITNPDKYRAPFNATMQGSVAHAMQNVIRKAWDVFPNYLLCDIHDSVVFQCPTSEIRNVIEQIIPIMTRPFSGILQDDHVFPVRVSIGRRWKQWTPKMLYVSPNNVLKIQ